MLAARGRGELLYQFLRTIFKNRERPEFVGVKSIYQYLLANSSSRFLLHADQLSLNLRPTYSYMQSEATPISTLENFATLADDSLTLGLSESAMRLLENAYADLAERRASGRVPVVNTHIVAELLEPLAIVLSKHKVTPSLSTKGIFEILLRDGILKKVGRPPTKLPGWSHKPRGCTNAAGCQDCTMLNAFLASTDKKTWRFMAAEKRRRHVEYAIPYELFKMDTERSGSPYTLVVEKLGKEFAQEVKKYQESVHALEETLRPLRGDFLMKLLGDGGYRELILLDGLRAGTATEPGDVVGAKRSATEYAEGMSNGFQRPRI
jgi:hypothetical protein